MFLKRSNLGKVWICNWFFSEVLRSTSRGCSGWLEISRQPAARASRLALSGNVPMVAAHVVALALVSPSPRAHRSGPKQGSGTRGWCVTPSLASWMQDPLPRHCSTKIPPEIVSHYGLSTLLYTLWTLLPCSFFPL